MTSEDRKTKALAALGVLMGLPALIAVLSIWRGFILSILWGWFVVPAFGLPALSIAFAIGVALIVGHLSHEANVKRDDKKGFGAVVAGAFIGPAFTLLIGWIVTWFI